MPPSDTVTSGGPSSATSPDTFVDSADGGSPSASATGRVTNWGRSDWVITSLLFLVTALSRIPFRTVMLYAWDSVLYTRAIEHFDITLQQPQPPGHIFYVGLIWLVNHAFGNANTTMVWLSVFFAAAAVAALYWLGRLMFGRDTGLAAALLLATSLSFWALSEVAYPYTLLAFLSTLVAGMSYLVWQGSRAWVLPAALTLGIASGFRQDLLPFLLPLLAVVSWNKGRWRLAGAVALIAAAVAAWYVPSFLLSGGFDRYQEASSTQTEYLMTYFSVFGQGAEAVFVNTYTLIRFSILALVAGGLLVPVFFLFSVSPGTRGMLRDRRILFLAVWMAPSVLFYIFIHIGEYGYVFSFLPAALLLGVWALKNLADRIAARTGKQPLRVMWALAAPMITFNMLLFLVLSPPLSANRIAARDDILRSKVDTIRQNFSPRNTLILSVFDYEAASYYLPEFNHWHFDPSVDQNPSTQVPPGIERVVVFEEYLSPSDPEIWLRLPLDRGQTLLYSMPEVNKTLKVDWNARKVYVENP